MFPAAISLMNYIFREERHHFLGLVQNNSFDRDEEGLSQIERTRYLDSCMYTKVSAPRLVHLPPAREGCSTCDWTQFLLFSCVESRMIPRFVYSAFHNISLASTRQNIDCSIFL